MPCSTCGGGSFEPPPLPLLGAGDDPTGSLGAGDDRTGSLAGWIVAGLRLCVVGAGANEGSLTAEAGVAVFFSGLFVFRPFPCVPSAATGATAGAADTALGDDWDGSPPAVPENSLATPMPTPTERAPPRITSTGTRTASARRRSAPVPGSMLSAAATRRPKASPSLLPDLLPASTDLGQEARRGAASTGGNNHLFLRN